MDNKVVVMIKMANNPGVFDIEIPLNITANELIYGLKQAFNLAINMDNPDECFLRMENPIGILHGDTLLSEYGIRNGSTIIIE